MAWLSGWGNRIPITIDNTVVDAALTWFPTPLICSGGDAGKGSVDVGASGIFTDLTTNNLKIAVTANDGTTELKVEIEDWDHTNEDFVLWVGKTGHVIDDDPGTAEKIYLYWDSTHADNTTNVGVIGSAAGQAVWDDDYEAVYHLSESTTPYKDSTSNERNSTGADAPTRVDVAGSVGYAQDFTRADSEYIEFGGWFALDDYSDGTVELRLKNDSVLSAAGTHIALSARDGGTDTRLYIRQRYTTEPILAASVGDSADFADVAISVDTWYDSAIIWDSGTAYFRVDGSQIGTDSYSVGTGSDDYNMRIGTYAADATNPFDGVLDEFRISSTPRTSAWIDAAYYAKSDNFLTWGSKETDVINGIVGIDAISSMSFAGIRLRPGVGSISSTPSLSFAGNRTASAISDIESISSLTTAADRTRFVLSAIESIASLALDGDRTAAGVSAIDSVSSLISAGNRTASAVSAIDAISSVIASGDRVATAIAAIIAVSSMSSIAYRKRLAELAVNSSASLAIDADRIASAIVAINSISSLIANADGGAIVYGIAAIQSIASLAIDANRKASVSSEIDSVASLTASGGRLASAIAYLQSVASLDADPTRLKESLAVINAISSLDIAAIRNRLGVASITSVSSLDSSAQVFKLAVAAIESIASLAISANYTVSASAAINAISALIADASSGILAAVAIVAVASITSAGVKVTSGEVTITAVSSADLAALAYISQTFGYTGTLTAGDVLVIDTDAMTVKLNGSSTRPLMTGSFPLLGVGSNILVWKDGGEVPDLTFETKHEPRYL